MEALGPRGFRKQDLHKTGCRAGFLKLLHDARASCHRGQVPLRLRGVEPRDHPVLQLVPVALQLLPGVLDGALQDRNLGRVRWHVWEAGAALEAVTVELSMEAICSLSVSL